MKAHIAITTAAVAMFLAGCATTSTVVQQRVGPAKDTVDNSGSLVVYSAFTPAMNLVDPDTDLHSDYTIRSSDGTVCRQVKNWVSKVLSEPKMVKLAPGNYTVEARAAGEGRVQVPVVIEANRVTAVHLDGANHPKLKDVDMAKLVTLPREGAVGWGAD